LWKLDYEEEYFRIFDSKKLIAGYFDPDYGDIFPKENSEQIISLMQKNHDPILGGMLLIPLVKFRLFDTDLDTVLSNVQENISRVSEHLQKWNNFIINTKVQFHSIRIRYPNPYNIYFGFICHILAIFLIYISTCCNYKNFMSSFN